MARDERSELTPRQRRILAVVVSEYVATGQPIGSKHLVERAGLPVSASTVRNEFAELEARGLLTHPHTSAGRVPTERGYRVYADELLEHQEVRPGSFPLGLSALRREVDAALQTTTEMLSSVTRLLALVSAPPLETTTVRHVEVLALQPQTVMVVVITSTGGITKRIFSFEKPVDVGLANWVREYLNERLGGVRLGSAQLRRRLEDPSLGAAERTFIDTINPAFTELVEEDQRLYVGGAAGLLDELPDDELDVYRRVLSTLEERAALLEILGRVLDPRRPFVRVGGDLEHPTLQDVALVGASYGLTNRVLGAVSLLGPVRMDYGKAIRSVRGAAHELSRFVEEVYEDN
jgi:heat-inducible transcriptional repressor